MGKVVTPITATVETITKTKSGQYGDYRSVLFIEEGSGEKIWKSFDPDSDELTLLERGARVQLVPAGKTQQGKDKHNIVLLSAPPPAQVRTQATKPQVPLAGQSAQPIGHWGIEKKRELALKVDQGADLMAYCLKVAQKKFVETGLVQDEESVRTLAKTLFIQALRG